MLLVRFRSWLTHCVAPCWRLKLAHCVAVTTLHTNRYRVEGGVSQRGAVRLLSKFDSFNTDVTKCAARLTRFARVSCNVFHIVGIMSNTYLFPSLIQLRYFALIRYLAMLNAGTILCFEPVIGVLPIIPPQPRAGN